VTPGLQFALVVVIAAVAAGHSAVAPPGILGWACLLVVFGVAVAVWARPLGRRIIALNALATILLLLATIGLADFAIYRAEDACQARNPVDRLVTINRHLNLVHNQVTCRYRADDGQQASALVSFADLFA